MPLLDHKDEMLVKLAAMTIANMASVDSRRKILNDLHAAEPLIRLLDSRDEEVLLIQYMGV